MKILNRTYFYHRVIISTLMVTGLLLSTSCKKFLDIPLPANAIAGDAAFSTDKSTAAVLNSVYGFLSAGLVFDGNSGLDDATSLYTDDLLLTQSNALYLPYYSNALTPAAGGTVWTALYKQMNPVNLTITAMRNSPVPNKKQWLGEALFLRGLLNFYLVNLYGNIPIVTGTDYTTNASLSRSSADLVYKQIVSDLVEAEGLLPSDFRSQIGVTTTDRGRPNSMAAAALLARVYLYTKDWTNAEAQSTIVINNTTSFQLVNPSLTFLANSKETIWALAPVSPALVKDYGIFNNNAPAVMPAVISTYVASILRPSVVSQFETGDNRQSSWTRQATSPTAPGTIYTLINKYKSAVSGAEYIMVLRFAEQYLIRSEARAQLNNISGSQSDINVIRGRAALPGTTASTPATLLDAIAKERQLEFFAEGGHRFFDLRRTGKLDGVMSVVAPQKGGAWQTYMQYWPIPVNELVNDPNLTQTPGY